MKSFNDYSGIEEPQQEDDLLLPEGYVYDQEPLLEGTKSSHADLPAVLVMRRMAVRLDRKSTRLNSSHIPLSRMPSSA